MSAISEKIKEVFPELAVLKNQETDRVFAGNCWTDSPTN